MLALFATDDGGKQSELRPLFPAEDGIYNLVYGLLFDFPPAFGAVRRANPCEKQAVIVVDFRHRPHCGTGVPVRGLLLNRNGGGKPRYHVNVRLVHTPQELPRIRRQAFHITPLTFGKERVKGKGTFARARKPAYSNKLVAGQLHVHIFQIVFPRSLNDYLFASFHRIDSDTFLLLHDGYIIVENTDLGNTSSLQKL